MKPQNDRPLSALQTPNLTNASSSSNKRNCSLRPTTTWLPVGSSSVVISPVPHPRVHFTQCAVDLTIARQLYALPISQGSPHSEPLPGYPALRKLGGNLTRTSPARSLHPMRGRSYHSPAALRPTDLTRITSLRTTTWLPGLTEAWWQSYPYLIRAFTSPNVR